MNTERILDVKLDGSKLLVTEADGFFKCQYRDPKPNEQIMLGPDDLLPAVLRGCHAVACAKADLPKTRSLEWTRLSRTVERVTAK